MSYPNLDLKTGGVLHAQNTGVPTDGNNVFDAGIDLVALDKELGGVDAVNEWLTIEVVPLGDSVTAARFVSRDGNALTINFAQGGADEALVIASFRHSGVR